MVRIIPAVAVSVALLAGAAAGAAERTAIGAQELSSIAQRIESSEQFKQAAARGSDGRMFLVNAARYEAAGGGQEVVEVLYYKYEGGVTLRATLDAKRGNVLEVQELKAYPTPLAREEHAEALRLARELNPPAKSLLATAPGEVDVEVAVPVVSNPNDPRYGHRLVFLTLYRKAGGGPAAMIEVDLTQKSVRPLNGGA
jgi:hypothetical protein